MRIRTIKPEMPGSATMAKVSRDARLLMVWMTDADDHGVLPAAPKRLAGQLFPHDNDVTPAEIERWLNELDSVGLILRYSSNDAPYVQLSGWEEHQSIAKPGKARYPLPQDQWSILKSEYFVQKNSTKSVNVEKDLETSDFVEESSTNSENVEKSSLVRGRACAGPRTLDLGPRTIPSQTAKVIPSTEQGNPSPTPTASSDDPTLRKKQTPTAKPKPGTNDRDPTFDAAAAILTARCPNDTAVHPGWIGEIIKAARRITPGPKHSPATNTAAALIAEIVTAFVGASDTGLALIADPDRQRIISQAQTLAKAHPETTFDLVTEKALNTRQASPNITGWAPHGLISRTLTTWDINTQKTAAPPGPKPADGHNAALNLARNRASIQGFTADDLEAELNNLNAPPETITAALQTFQNAKPQAA
jgi:hypothetical protein